MSEQVITVTITVKHVISLLTVSDKVSPTFPIDFTWYVVSLSLKVAELALLTQRGKVSPAFPIDFTWYVVFSSP